MVDTSLATDAHEHHEAPPSRRPLRPIREFGDRKATGLKFSRATKSSLGYDLLAAANNGAIRVWQPDGEHHTTLWRQLRLARRELLPGGQLAWHVDEKEGHDDHLLSLALALRAAQRGRPRIARSRTNRTP